MSPSRRASTAFAVLAWAALTGGLPVAAGAPGISSPEGRAGDTSRTAERAGGGSGTDENAAPAPAVESLTLDAALDRISDCRAGCDGIAYFWTERMPLSELGIDHIEDAAERLGTDVAVVRFEELAEYAYRTDGEETTPLAEAVLGAGALAHAPALVMYREGAIVGPAILGYKSTDAYVAMIAERLGREVPPAEAYGREAPSAILDRSVALPQAAGRRGSLPPTESVLPTDRPAVDYQAVGRPGAYFRYVPGRNTLAYESNLKVYLLDLDDGSNRVAPGYIDFVPTPDGRYFVTPGPGNEGLAFYDADEVFGSAGTSRASEVEPFFVDRSMTDQYPSVGTLQTDGETTRYRVLTSWFRTLAYRDYEVRHDPATGASTVRPLGDPVRPCADASLSTPIMSQDGQEVAARDEATGTTKIFRMLRAGRCREMQDLGVATSKVAWHRTGSMLAFVIPRRSSRRVGGPDELDGIFLYDRASRELARVPDSEGAKALAFPDFVGDDAVVFLLPGGSSPVGEIFRVVDGIR